MNKDITGRSFNNLTAVRFLYTNKHRAAVWEFKCSCAAGTLIERSASTVRSGHTKSCGCVYRETRRSSATTHGECYDPAYQCHRGMMARCYDKNHVSYHRYGGIGVTVHPRWHDRSQFKKDIGPRPSPNHTLDRFPNRSGHYEPGNLRWATRVEQQRNMKSNVMLTHQGKTMCMQAWSEEKGWHRSKIKNRRYRGWSDDKILGTP
jgi:hypothetical protein